MPVAKVQSTYTIKSGDNFYLLAKGLGVGVNQVVQANPGIEPDKLEVGQTVKLPKPNPTKALAKPGMNTFADSPTEGESFAGRNLDQLGVKIGDMNFDLKRVIDNEVPHEIHIILPKTEIRSTTRGADSSLSETFITLENVDIVHSPRQ
jgi:LysM repeat protein